MEATVRRNLSGLCVLLACLGPVGTLSGCSDDADDTGVDSGDGDGDGDGDGGVDGCYSPSENLDIAYEPGALGCPCDADDEDACIGGVALICEGDDHWQSVEDGPCEPRTLTSTECEAEGGQVFADPGDGSLDACPDTFAHLGSVSGLIEGGLCCEPTVTSCKLHNARFIGSCEPASRFYWTGFGCEGRTGCSCEGPDCDAGVATEAECVALHEACAEITEPCGGFFGNTCAEDEYCAYLVLGGCGVADVSAVCQPRPHDCADDDEPVCSCDGQTYDSACAAAMAGQGVAGFGACG
jgi:hypothetical protein